MAKPYAMMHPSIRRTRKWCLGDGKNANLAGGGTGPDL